MSAPKMDPIFTAGKFIRYSLNDIGGPAATYTDLTPQERELCSEEEFIQLRDLVYSIKVQ